MILPGDAPVDEGGSLERGARRRRARFASRAAAAAALGGKPPMASFAPAAMAAYVEHCLVDDLGGGVRLAAAPGDEARVYADAAALGAGAAAVLPSVSAPVVIATGSFGPLAAAACLAAGALARGRLER